jgi:hypothetical protein
MTLEISMHDSAARRSLRTGCAVIVGLGIVVTTALILLLGGIQARFIRPPLGELRLGPITLVGARVVAACATPNLASCRDDFFVLNLEVPRASGTDYSYRLFRVPLK